MKSTTITRPRRTTRGRRGTTGTTTRVGRATLATAAVVLSFGGLNACSSEPEAGETTCGEYAAFSAAEKRDFIRDAAATDDSVDAETRKIIEKATDDQVDVIAGEFVTACEAEDDSTALDDIE